MPQTPPPPDTPTVQKIDYEPYPPDRFFSEEYANNIFYEPSAWDLKLIFGLLDQRDGKSMIRQHTAISMAWPQIKLLYFFLGGYIEFQEYLNGKIVIPPRAYPPTATPPTEEQKKAEPSLEKAYEIFAKIRADLIKEQKT